VGTQDVFLNDILHATVCAKDNPKELMQAIGSIQDKPGCVLKLKVVILTMYCEFSNKRYQVLARFKVLTAVLLKILSLLQCDAVPPGKLFPVSWWSSSMRIA
jgi:hypothetical protein